MRPSGPPEGFTLLEMTLALSAAGLLVALLVGTWIALARNGLRDERQQGADRLHAEQVQRLERLLRGALWSPSSLRPEGPLPWTAAPGALAFWSREACGLVPGPARWSFHPRPGGLRGTVRDLQGGPEATLDLEGIRDLQLEVCLHQATPQGEETAWVPLQAWPQGVPFRPAALRFRIDQGPQGFRWVTAWP